MEVKIFQIYYDSFTKQRVDRVFVPVFNPPKDRIREEVLFENAVIENVFNQNHDAKFLGVTSWKMSEVTGMTGQTLIQRVLDNKDMDVILYCPKISPAYYTGNIIQRYKDRRAMVFDLLVKIDEQKILPHRLSDSQWVFNFRNYWVANKKTFNEFVSQWIVPLNRYFRDTPGLNFPVHYKGATYNGQPFASELMMGVFLAQNKRVKFIQL